MERCILERSTNIKKYFLQIISAVVNNVSLIDEDDGFSNPSSEEWNEILTLSKHHNIFPLVFEKASEIDSFRMIKEYPFYLTQVFSTIGLQIQHTDTFLKLYEAFLREDIHPIVVKGLICRSLYGEYQDHRPSSDEDIVIEIKDFEKVRHILEREGFVGNKDSFTEKQVEYLQEFSFYNSTVKFSIDVHVNLFGYKNKLRQKMNTYFGDIFCNYQNVEISGVLVRTLNHTEHLLYLMLHTFKHFTSSGMGVRHVLDVLMYIREYGEQCDWTYLNKVLKDVNAELFFSDLIHIGNKYLGFELSPNYEANCPEALLDDILFGGIFGNSTETLQTAGQITYAAMAGQGVDKSSGFMGHIKIIFPDKHQLMGRHPILAEKPWLLPIFWVQRWGRVLKRSKRNGMNVTSEGVKLGQQRVELLKKYKVL